MKKEELKKQIDDTINLIKTNSKDAKFAGDLLDKLMSLKGQYDVEETLVHVPLTGKEEVIDTGGSFKFYRNNIATIFHSTGFDFVQRKGGYDVVIKNYLKAAHCPFDSLFALWKKRNEGVLTEEETKAYESYLLAAVNMSQVINIAACKEEWQATLTLLIQEWLTEVSQALDASLQPENPEKEAEFENTQDLLNNITK